MLQEEKSLKGGEQSDRNRKVTEITWDFLEGDGWLMPLPTAGNTHMHTCPHTGTHTAGEETAHSEEGVGPAKGRGATPSGNGDSGPERQ